MATCYYGRSTYDDEMLDRPCCERHFCILCWCCCRKQERGILILQDLRQHNYKNLNKASVPSLAHVKLVMASLAKFHGTWHQFLNNKLDVDPK